MTVRTVIKMGHPLLAVPAAPVQTFGGPELEQLVADLWDTMAAEGGIGIAAPQIGVSARVVVFGLDEPLPDKEMDIPPTVLVNPVITPLTEETDLGWEGCLSVPGMRGLVPRFVSIRYTGFDAAGARIEREVEGYHARVVQHECDHLDGILYPLRIPDLRQFGYADEIERALGLATAESPTPPDATEEQL